MKRTCGYRVSHGLTLVELIVVISVIGILASISVLAWGAWQRTTAMNTLKNDLIQAAAQLKTDLNWKNVYPVNMGQANNGKGLPKSEGTTYDYDRPSAGEYCLEASSDRPGVPTFFISSQSSTPKEGTCPP